MRTLLFINMSIRRWKMDPIRIPPPIIRDIPPPVVDNLAPPVVNGIRPPVVDVPDFEIEYPVIDIPTEEQFQEDLADPPQQIPQEPVETPRELPKPEVPNPTIDVGGLEIPLPKPEVAITAGTTAAVTTVVALFSAMLVQQLKTALTPLASKLVSDKKKKKKKGKKPLLHFVDNEGVVEIFEYSEKGVRVVDRVEGSLETYLRDQIEINPYYEQESKIIVDDSLKDKFTKEGVKRFKSLFTPAKVILKKLSSKFSF